MLVSFDPRDTPGSGEREEARASEVLGSARDGRRLAFPDRRRERRFAASPRRPGSPTSGTRQTQQFAHVSGVLVATPDGRLSRYFYGVEYSPKELRLALVESGRDTSVGRSTSCCSTASTTTPRRPLRRGVMNILRLGGVLTVGLIAGIHRADAAARIAPRPRRGTPKHLCFLGFRSFPNRRPRSPPRSTTCISSSSRSPRSSPSSSRSW